MSIELVDLVNPDGEVVCTGIERSEAEKLNGIADQHIPTVGAVVLNSLGQVLVHERAEGKRFAGCLDHVYGAIDSGENPEEAVQREIKEELDVETDRIIEVRKGLNPYDYYLTLFAAITDDEAMTDINPREVAWVGYLTLQELKDGRDSGKYKFTKNFFTDLNDALAVL